MFCQNPELIIFEDDQDLEVCLNDNDMSVLDATGGVCSI